MRNSISRLIAQIASIEIPGDSWNELLGFLSNCCHSSSPDHRLVGVYVLYNLFEVIAHHLSEHLNELFKMFLITLNDPDSLRVRVTTLLYFHSFDFRALGKIADFIEPTDQAQIREFKNAVPSMVDVLKQCLDAGDVEGATKAFEVFDNLLMLVSFFFKKLGNSFIV